MVRESNQCEFDAIIIPITFYDLSKLFKSFNKVLPQPPPPPPLVGFANFIMSQEFSGKFTFFSSPTTLILTCNGRGRFSYHSFFYSVSAINQMKKESVEYKFAANEDMCQNPPSLEIQFNLIYID